jgi:hypothetical protein
MTKGWDLVVAQLILSLSELCVAVISEMLHCSNLSVTVRLTGVSGPCALGAVDRCVACEYYTALAGTSSHIHTMQLCIFLLVKKSP